jgi:hypothetical protein
MNKKEERDRHIIALGYLGAWTTAAVVATVSPDGEKLTNGVIGYIGGGAGAMAAGSVLIPPPKRSPAKRR